MGKKPAGPDAGTIMLAIAVILAAAWATGILTVSYVPRATSATEPAKTTTTVTGSDMWHDVDNGKVTPMPEVTPRPLPPSHDGGVPPISTRLALASMGFPDKSVLMDPPVNAQKVTSIFSYYWPNLGGTNCSSFRSEIPSWASDFPEAVTDNGWCWSRFSNGERWEYWMNRAVACPQEYPFGTKIYAFGREWLCKDHGGAIVKTPEGDWIDFLTPHPEIRYGSTFEIWVIYP